MPVSLAQITQNTASITLQVGENEADTLTVVYRPAMVTERTFLVMNMDATSDTTVAAGIEAFNAMLVSLIADWDFYEDAAQTVKVPLDAVRFATIPLFLRMAVFQAIVRDVRPEAMALKTLS